MFENEQMNGLTVIMIEVMCFHWEYRKWWWWGVVMPLQGTSSGESDTHQIFLEHLLGGRHCSKH